MVAANSQTDLLSVQLYQRQQAEPVTLPERAGCVQPIGDLMAQVLARYLPAEDLWQERSRIALKTVSAAAG